ncbi:MAG: PD40 domain-containing protein [Lentisphaeria bacterium]|nr:PD40 domain-containing protein [Lentisphaeria bacterium]
MVNLRYLFLCLAAMCFCMAAIPESAGAEEGLRIQGRVRENPTLNFKGITGDSNVSAAVGSFMKACGWFDVVHQDNADYTITGSSSGGRTTLQVAMGGAPLAAWTVHSPDERRTAKLLVDTLLEKLFNVKNLCFSRIAFCADTARGIKEIYTCDIDGNDIKQVTRFNSLCVEPCWFPDGKSIAYTRYAQSRTEIVETRFFPRLQSRIITSFPGLNTGVAVSPDKNNVAMILSPDHQVDLYVRPLSGNKLLRLTRGRAVEASPCWSPDGKNVCFVSDQNGRPRIYSVPVTGGTPKQLPSVGREAVTPDWSNDDQIIYATTVGGSYTLAVLDLKTGENMRATTVPGRWESPSWGPDNRQVVCKRSDGPRASLFIVDTWTGKARQLLITRNHLSMPSWSKGVR